MKIEFDQITVIMKDEKSGILQFIKDGKLAYFDFWNDSNPILRESPHGIISWNAETQVSEPNGLDLALEVIDDFAEEVNYIRPHRPRMGLSPEAFEAYLSGLNQAANDIASRIHALKEKE